MSNFRDFDSRYNLLLQKIDKLRKKGIPETDLEMLRTRIELRDILESKKKNSNAIQKIVPRLLGVKTIAIKTNTLGDQVEAILNSELTQNKYVIMGMVVGIIALFFIYLKNVGK